MPIAELQQLDAACVRFEQALADDPDTRIEPFVADLEGSQQRLVVRELMRQEIASRQARGQATTADEYAQRFPQWADELRRQAMADIDNARTASETVDQTSPASGDTKADHQTWPGLPAAALRQDAPATNMSAQEAWRASVADASFADLPADGVLGHYQLQSVIGRGGMGLVVRARDTNLARDVAIKILAPQISHDANVNERFLREAQAAAAIRHSHVVTIHAVESINQVPFLVMELVEGPTLEEHLRASGKLPADEVATLAYQIAQGLAAAHKLNLIHRDVKPANILLEKVYQHGNGLRASSTWHVKITDFGLARVADEIRLTSSGVIAGTPQYMSPEQANGQELDVRSDLFSLGCVMYAMCAGRPAFEAESAIAIVRQVADKPAPALHDFSPETPDWLVAVIEKLMSKSPGDRIQTATEVAEVLARHQHDSQNGITPSTSAAPRLIRQRQLAVALCSLFVIALIGFWTAQIVFRVETRHGTLSVKTDDPDVQISVKSGGTEVALFFPTQEKEIPLKVGEYTIELVKGKNGLKLSTNKFEIQSGRDQKSVTVEFEPAIVASMDPPTVEEQAKVEDPLKVTHLPKVTEQSKAVDVEKPFAWPAEALWHGRVAAPDLSQAKELYRDDFANLDTNWPIGKTAAFEFGREQGTYFISAVPGLAKSVWIDDKTYANFACQVVGRVKFGGTQWFLSYTSATNDVTIRFHLNGLQSLEVSILNDGPPRVSQTIRHNALKKGDEFNKLLVVALGNRIEIYANNVAICDPIVLDEITPPGRFALGAVATTRHPVRAEFKSFTIWSAEGLPTLKERLASGEPYNPPPSPAAAKVEESRHEWPTDAPPPAIAPFTPAESKAHQEAWAKHLGLPVEMENSIGMKFRVIPPGEFLMGSTEQEIERELKLAKEKNLGAWVSQFISYEGPRRRVTLTMPFGLSIHEVTRGQFRQFVDERDYKTEVERDGNGSGFKDGQMVFGPEFLWNTNLAFKPPQTDDNPVVNVSWNDAAEFCKWLSEKEGVTYRLPWEAEWEFACRSGNEGRFCFGNDEARLHDYAWLGDGFRIGAIPVGQMLENAFGLFDMHGNVWEFCQDWHAKYPANAETDPTGPDADASRAGRGGAWGGTAEMCRSAFRSNGDRGASSAGFRVARTLPVERGMEAGERGE